MFVFGNTSCSTNESNGLTTSHDEENVDVYVLYDDSRCYMLASEVYELFIVIGQAIIQKLGDWMMISACCT